MKLFMKGTTSVPQGTLSFMPDEIFLSKEPGKIGDPDEIVRLYNYDVNTGCESISDGTNWKCKWSHVGLDYRGYDYGKDFSMETLKEILDGKQIIDMVTSFDGELVMVHINELEIIKYEPTKNPDTYTLTKEQLGEGIEYIA